MATTAYSPDSYVQSSFVDPMNAQYSFSDHFDLENPSEAASAYAKLMHQHTMRQLQLAKDSASRRSSSGASTASMSTQSSMDESA